MRKQMKIAAVLSATALLAIGASFTAMAAEKGTWALEDEGWVCYDKDGDLYEDVFCLDGDKEYYVGDDGVMLTDSWVDYDGNMYYVDVYGEKVKSEWQQLVPHNDEDAEEEYYWFKASGKMARNEKLVINGATYYFGNEGQMLTGWVDTSAFDEATSITGAVFCNEDGARLSKTWVETKEPGAEEDDEDTFWYYIGSKGAAQTGKAKSINGETYLFGTDGKMLSGWVEFDGANYVEIGGEGSTATIATGDEVYFCGDSDDGHVKKNRWIKEWKPSEYYDEDADKDQYWFWIQKDGTVYVPTAEEATAANAYKFEDADLGLTNKGAKTVAIKNISDKYYAFNANGEMQSGLLKLEAGMYYFGGSNDGARKAGSVTLEDGYGVEGKFLFNTTSTNKGVGITGPKSGKLYEDGLLIAADDYKYEVVTVDGNQYIVNRSGSIQTTKKVYKDGDEIICDAENATFSTETANKGAVTF